MDYFSCQISAIIILCVIAMYELCVTTSGPPLYRSYTKKEILISNEALVHCYIGNTNKKS
jgi:hypothetical protein